MSKKSIWWSTLARLGLFWLPFAAAFVAVEKVWPWVQPAFVAETTLKAISGDFEKISTQSYAFALASIIATSAFCLAIAFGTTHAVISWFSIRRVTAHLRKFKGVPEFTEQFETVHQSISNHPIIGHAWSEFVETLIPPKEKGEPYQNTVRPQTFFNMALAREQMPGLKIMSSLPGYFVGIGLLLTFIGLVLALYKAAAAVNAADANAMQTATRELLQVATFKFATSIAGLGSSIFLSFVFRCYGIWLESNLNHFCHVVERNLRFLAVQSLTAQMNDTVAHQLTELKQINSAEFFSRMGEAVAPQIQSAFASAIAPVTTSIDHAINRLTDSSQSGVTDLISRFTEGVQGGAGTELRELAGTLKSMQASLLEAQRGIHGTGEDFGRRMSEAAENLNRLVSEAGANLGASSEKSRVALEEVVGALRSAFDQANKKIEENLAQAAAGASGKLEDAMGRVLSQLETQIAGLNSGLTSFQGKMSDQIDHTAIKVAEAQSHAAEALTLVSGEMAKAIQAGVADVMDKVRAEFERFTSSLNSSEASMASQASAIRDVTSQTRLVADAFSQTAQDVRVASAPMIQSSERIANATEKMTAAIGQSVLALATSQASAKELAETLIKNIETLNNMWAGYVGRFESIDKELASALTTLSEATTSQVQSLTDYAQRVDSGFANAIDKLSPFLTLLTESTGEIGESVSDLSELLKKPALA